MSELYPPMSGLQRVGRECEPPPSADSKVRRDDEWFEVPPSHCPKCVAPRPSAGPSCSRCGLSTRVAQRSFAAAPWLKARWRLLLAQWSRLDRHDALITDAHERSELAQLGRLYRIYLVHRPNDELARYGRDAVARRAHAASVVYLEPRRTWSPLLLLFRLAGVASFLFACSVALYGIARLSGGH